MRRAPPQLARSRCHQLVSQDLSFFRLSDPRRRCWPFRPGDRPVPPTGTSMLHGPFPACATMLVLSCDDHVILGRVFSGAGWRDVPHCASPPWRRSCSPSGQINHEID
jgi:hypothetical protein